MVRLKYKNRPQKDALYVSNHEIYKCLCEFSIGSGETKEVLRSNFNLEELNIVKGFYVRREEGLIGIIAGKNGPILFINNQQYPLSEPIWEIQRIKGAGNNHFMFTWGSMVVCSMIYEQPKELGTHFAGDEEFMDFFNWLYNGLQSDSFIRFYTF